METTLDKQNIGNAGEYYIASLLSAYGFTATITLGRAEKYDILALSPKGRTIKISVKTRIKENIKRFPLSKKDEKGGDTNSYYAFIRLNELKKEPDFWIIPGKRVGKLIKNAHKKYLATPGKRVKQRKDTNLRNLWIKMTKTSKPLFPKDWGQELTTYYKNIKQLW